MSMAPTEVDSAQGVPTESEAKKPKESKTRIGNFASIEGLAKCGLAEIVDATKAVNAFPQGAARDLYCAYPTFGKIIDEQSDRVLGLISKVLKWQNIKGNIQRRQPDEQFEMLLECNDIMLERLNSNLDAMSCIKKQPQTILMESRVNAAPNSAPVAGSRAGSWNIKTNEPSRVFARLLTAKNIARPQIKFQIPVDNSVTTPFIPKLKDKPNSLKPLAVLPEYDDSGNIVSFLHPYETELDKFEVNEAVLKRKSPEMPPAMDVTEYLHVQTLQQLKTALEEIRQHTVIAVDVEHHSYRSFLGFTCLVQISTVAKDYLFDTLELREDMHLLNEVFTDPKVVKIFHGADSDIEWLQRDLSIYVVNMFDTHQAAKALSFARLSLSYLLKHYCDIEADKTFQLADWRIRPLPEELVTYARQDTHFLIYIYERLTNDLLDASNQQTNLLRTIFQRSTEICKKRYVKPVIGPDTYMDLFRKSKRNFDNRQLFALREIYLWRDAIARQEDESYGYVLPNHMMLQISESLPREMQGILACCNPIPPLVRQHLHALHQIILRAREQPLVKPILETEVIHRIAVHSAKDYNSKLYCPHDLSHCEEFRDDLPTLLNFSKLESTATATALPQIRNDEPTVEMCKPVLSVFNNPDHYPMTRKQRTTHKLVFGNIQAISPYQRYLAVLPLAEKEKREEAERLEAENKKRKLCPAEPMMPVKKEPMSENNERIQEKSYNLPIREMLKRRHDQSGGAKAAKNENESPTKPKRTKLEVNPNTTTISTPTDDKLKFVNLPPTKKEQKLARLAASKTAKETTPNAIQETSQSTIIDVDDNSDGDPADEAPSTSQASSAQREQHTRQHERTKNNRKKFKGNKHPQQLSDKPVPSNFEYHKVDFKKFRGGAQRAKGTELKPQFHGKNNPNKTNNKKFNKLFTFSNVKGKK